MTNPELQNSVDKILSSLQGLNSLKKLFSELNYNPVNQSLSRRGWREQVSEVLAEDPILIAAGGDDFHVIYGCFNQRLLVKAERLVVEELLKNHPYSLFVFSDKQQKNWTFINVKYDSRQDNKRILRRIRVSPGEQLRTAIERLSLLDLEGIDLDSPLAIQQRHDEAFDVEKVTQKFFKQYREVFENVERLITPTIDHAEKRRLFIQKLFNRLMFIAFIQKKGWLNFKEKTNYLEALRRDYQLDNSIADKNFYRDRLTHLFFSGLNNSQAVDMIGINNGGYLKEIIGTVPYLNGGLFEQDEEDRDPTIIVPDAAVDSIIHDLFNNFNFTVTESTPLDVEVAVDPEMLGKVFEELVTGRHESGSYYTPKPIVSFMGREALKGYLGGYEELVDGHNANSINVPIARKLLEKLAKIKVVDPACGSGAYLLGMLHELHTLTRLLDTRLQEENSRDDYHRKLNIIQNNLYGVDKDEFAVNIARLRLWLSLAVEFDGDHPEPLPNLDFKIESGDSLTAPSPENIEQQTISIRSEIIRQYQTAKNSYLRVIDGGQKQTLKAEINRLKVDIASWTHTGSNNILGFDWAVEFAEVFAQGGFDIVLANPPYGATVEDQIRDLYFNRITEGAQSKDTYGLFMARGLQLLRAGGQLCYIVSDTWRTIKSHKPLRKRFIENTTISHIIDLPSWIFGATVNTVIFTVTKNQAPDEHNLITADLRSIQRDNWDKLNENLTAVATHSVDLQTTDYARYTYPQSLIVRYQNISLFIGIPKLYTLLNDHNFVRLGNIADGKDGMTTGENYFYIRKNSEARGNYLILNESQLLSENEINNLTQNEKSNGVDPNNYSGRCFVPYDKGGESDITEGWLPNYHVPTQYYIDWSIDSVKRLKTLTRADRKRLQGDSNSSITSADERTKAAVIRNPSYYFAKGLTFSRTGIYSPTFRLSSGGVFDSKGNFIDCFRCSPISALGVLNSLAVKYLMKVFLCHTVQSESEAIENLPTPFVEVNEYPEIEILVKDIIKKQKINLRYPYYLYEQKDIDKCVYRLYNLSYEDIREIELWYCRRYSKLAESQGILAEVNQKYARYIEHCQRVLAKPPAYWKSHPILTLIAQGEGSKLEFKETLRVDIKQNITNDSVLFSSLKIIVAYLNTDGGKLLIGVSDKLEIKGLEPDYNIGKANNSDGFELQLRGFIQTDILPHPLNSNQIMVEFITLPEGEICKVEVKPLDKAEIATLRGDVFIRDGNRALKLKDKSLEYWKKKRSTNT